MALRLDQLAGPARDWAESLGPQGVAGLALVAFCGAFAWGGLKPLHDSVHEMRAQVEQISLHPRNSVATPAQAAKLATRDVDLPSAADALPQVMRLSDLAEEQGLKLRQGDYRLHRDKEAGVVAYQMHYPVTGAYVALRAFIKRALEEFPALALEEVLIRRNSIGAQDVEARLRFTLYLREK
ncbi:MAG: hypothetical protein ACKVQA_25800 [Burkholderiales bacterium]